MRFTARQSIIIILVAFLGCFLIGSGALAGDASMKMQVGIPNSSKFSQGRTITFNSSTGVIAEYVSAIYTYAIGVVGILATVVMMIGGFIWITAGGNPSRVGEAKSWIGGALAGLLLSLLSYTLLMTINPDLLKLRVTPIQRVDKIVLNENETAGAGQGESCLTRPCNPRYECVNDVTTSYIPTCVSMEPDDACRAMGNGTHCINANNEEGYCQNEVCMPCRNPGIECGHDHHCCSGSCNEGICEPCYNRPDWTSCGTNRICLGQTCVDCANEGSTCNLITTTPCCSPTATCCDIPSALDRCFQTCP
jgi:hypothetical protein